VQKRRKIPKHPAGDVVGKKNPQGSTPTEGAYSTRAGRKSNSKKFTEIKSYRKKGEQASNSSGKKSLGRGEGTPRWRRKLKGVSGLVLNGDNAGKPQSLWGEKKMVLRGPCWLGDFIQQEKSCSKGGKERGAVIEKEKETYVPQKAQN